MNTKVVADRDINDRHAEDLFELEQIFLESFIEFGPCETTKKMADSTLSCVRQIVSCEETMAKAARLRNDNYHFDIAWERVIHGSGIVRSMEARIAKWF